MEISYLHDYQFEIQVISQVYPSTLQVLQ